MGKETNDKKPLSVPFWIFVFFVTALPCVNVVAILFWAYYAKNETFRNYCRAMIVLFVLLTIFYVSVFVIAGYSSGAFNSYLHKWFPK